MHLGSGVAVAVAQIGSYSSKSTLSLGTSICHWCGPKKREKKKKRQKKKTALKTYCWLKTLNFRVPILAQC